jgi:ribosomal protein L35
LTKKSTKRKRQLRAQLQVNASDIPLIKRMLPGV